MLFPSWQQRSIKVWVCDHAGHRPSLELKINRGKKVSLSSWVTKLGLPGCRFPASRKPIGERDQEYKTWELGKGENPGHSALEVSCLSPVSWSTAFRFVIYQSSSSSYLSNESSLSLSPLFLLTIIWVSATCSQTVQTDTCAIFTALIFGLFLKFTFSLHAGRFIFWMCGYVSSLSFTKCTVSSNSHHHKIQNWSIRRPNADTLWWISAPEPNPREPVICSPSQCFSLSRMLYKWNHMIYSFCVYLPSLSTGVNIKIKKPFKSER